MRFAHHLTTAPVAAVLCLAAFFASAPARAQSACAAGGDEPASVASVDPGAELRLADGRLARLSGFEPAVQTPSDPDLADRTRAAIAAMAVRRPLSIRVLAATPDRWGRITIQGFAGSDDLATRAIAAGLGRYKAEPMAHACRDQLLAAEDAARRGALGLWRDPYYAVLGIDDRAAFAERAGTIVLAQGRLTAVLPGPYRTRLLFAGSPQGGRGLTATILPHRLKAFETLRVMFPTLIGRTLRLRGLLDLRFGPHIELAGPDDVEILAEDRGSTGEGSP